MTILLASFLATGSMAVDHPILGQCFSSIAEFRERNFPPEGTLDDADVQQIQEKGWIWIIDRTPSVNYSWSLLQKNDASVCLKGEFSASSVDLHRVRGEWIVDVNIPPIGDTAGKMGRYRLKKDGSHFALERCEEFKAEGPIHRFNCRDWGK